MTNITRLGKAGALALIAGLVLMLLASAPAYAAVSMGEADPVIHASNSDSTVIATFSPELGSTIEAGTSTDAVAYYGVVANPSASSSDVFWRITVSHETDALIVSDVIITEKGWYDEFGHDVADSAYIPTVNLDGDLVLTGNSGWGVEAGLNFTNVDEIVFDMAAPLGEYTITRELMDNSTTTPVSMGGSHVIMTELVMATSSDATAPAAPTVTSPTSPHSTTSNPIIVQGTAEADSTIDITGGADASTATTSGAGDWSASVNLNENATNTLMITATDGSGNTSSSTALIVTHGTTNATTTPPDDDAPSAPTVSTTFLCSTTTSIEIEGTAEAGSTVTITGNGTTTTATTTSSGNWSAILTLESGTMNSFSITATDSESNESDATTVDIDQDADCEASSDGGGGGGGGSRRDDDDDDGDPAEAFVLAGVVIDGGTTIISGLPGIPNTGTVLGITFSPFLRDLMRGMSGPDVIELQTKLFGAGLFRGPVTGFFGPLTEDAVERLQIGLGLRVTGILDAATRAILNNS